MDKNDNPQAVRFLESMARHGELEAGERFSALHPLSESAGHKKEFEWAKELCGFLNDNYDDETVKAIRTDCVCGSDFEWCANIRELYRNENDPHVFVEKANQLEPGFTLEYDGTFYYLVYPRCYCSCVNQTGELLPKAWCYCTLGFSKRMFNYIFDKEVEAVLLASVKQGGSECRIRIKA